MVDEHRLELFRLQVANRRQPIIFLSVAAVQLWRHFFLGDAQTGFLQWIPSMYTAKNSLGHNENLSSERRMRIINIQCVNNQCSMRDTMKICLRKGE